MLALPSALALIACNRTVDSQRGSDSGSAGSDSSGVTIPASEGGRRRGAEPPWVTRTVAAGTSFAASLDTTLDSSTNAEGDAVQATLTSDLLDDSGSIALPAGTRLLGRITEVVSARKVKKRSSLAFRFDHARLPDGTATDMSATEGFDGKGWTRKQGAIIGGSAAGGAILGQVLGHDTKSTVGGAVVGGAIAAGIIMSHVGEDIVLSSGSMMELILDTDISVERPATS